jgi:hypothetical protein
MIQKFVKTKQNEVKLFKILQDLSNTNVFVSNCVEEKKRKYETSFFWGKKAKKNEYNRSSTIEDLPLLILMDLWNLFNNILIILTLSIMVSEVLFTIWQGGQNVVRTAKIMKKKT